MSPRQERKSVRSGTGQPVKPQAGSVWPAKCRKNKHRPAAGLTSTPTSRRGWPFPSRMGATCGEGSSKRQGQLEVGTGTAALQASRAQRMHGQASAHPQVRCVHVECSRAAATHRKQVPERLAALGVVLQLYSHLLPCTQLSRTNS